MHFKLLKLASIAFLVLWIDMEGFSQDSNPAADGFRSDISDEKAIKIADEIMIAMGRRENWDKTRYLSWSFFGRRTHLWDRYTGDIRIEIPVDDMTILMNINSEKGKIRKNGEVLQNSDSIEKYLDLGKRLWINDSYWLVMPFKLKDSGVALRKIDNMSENPEGVPSDVLQLTFESVGVTPENKYLVFVGKDSRLINYWSFFRTADQKEADFSTPWSDYKKYNEILLSGNRGKNSLANIDVLNENEVDPEKFSKF
ncbi:MAG: hypothetical protein AAF363_01600 [Bacteroidota bacterium]